MKPANVILIGYRAVGKSTIGALLARRLGRPFLDLDAALEAEAGETIADLVAREGWPAFRQRERELVHRLAAEGGKVIATGGGVVLDEDNVRRLRAHGRLIWLRAEAATIRRRLAQGSGQVEVRPSLTGQGTLEEIESVLAVRQPLYQAAAEVTLTVDTASVEELVEQILQLVKTWEHSEP